MHSVSNAAADESTTTSPSDAAAAGLVREIAPELTTINDWSHSGVAVLRDGRVVVSTPGSGHVSVIDADGGVATFECGSGIYHGIAVDPDHPSRVWFADIGVEPEQAGLYVCDIDARELRDVAPAARGVAPVLGWRPTDVAVERGFEDPEGWVAWVADGCGRSLVHRVERGAITLTLDGSVSGLAFDCPHGIALDTRGAETLVVVADRANQRLVWWTLGGDFVRELRHPLITSPSSIAVRGQHLVVTELFGSVIAVDPADRVADIVTRSTRTRDGAWPNAGAEASPERPPLEPGQVNSPHGIAATSNGVVITEWIFGGRTLRLADELLARARFTPAEPADDTPQENETRELS